MKYLMILVFTLLTVVAYSEDFPIMLSIKSDVKIPDDFRDGVEEALTKLGYSLVDENAQKEALSENAKARNSECYDDECLVDTGKMLAARALISVEVDKKGETAFKFKGRFIDFETGTTTKTKVMYYEEGLSNFKKLSDFGKKFSNSLLGRKVSAEKKEKESRSNATTVTDVALQHPPLEKKVAKPEILLLKNERYKGKWDITVSLMGGSHEFYKEHNNEKDRFEDNMNGSLSGGGLGFGLTYRLNHWLGFYINSNILVTKAGNADMETVDINNPDNRIKSEIKDLGIDSFFMSLGTQFSFGDTQGKGIVYYVKTALSFGRDSYNHTIPDSIPISDEDRKADTLFWDLSTTTTFGVSLELGMNILFNSSNGIDLYILTYYGMQLSDDLNTEPFFLNLIDGHTLNILFGVRYNVFTF